MKAKHKRANLEAAKKWWESLPQRDKDSTTKPGSINQRTAYSA
ncbi:hypothetical protein [Intestinibacter sp.]